MTKMSWAEIEKSFESKETSVETLKLITLTNAIFGLTEQGKEWLKLMEETYFPMPVCPLDKPATYGYFREGQNQMLRDIRNYLKLHEEINKPKE